jgi:hypothetical protein
MSHSVMHEVQQGMPLPSESFLQPLPIEAAADIVPPSYSHIFVGNVVSTSSREGSVPLLTN